MHLYIVLSLSAIADAASMGPTFVCDELENLTNSDYESDCRLEIPDFHTASSEIHDIQNHSDTEEVSHPPVRVRPSAQETIPGTGRPLGEVAGYTELNKAMTDDLWSPFSSENDFNWPSRFVRSKVARSEIDAYFAKGLGGMDGRSFRSPYTLPPISTYWTHFVNTWSRRKPVLMIVDMPQLSIIKILLTVSAT